MRIYLSKIASFFCVISASMVAAAGGYCTLVALSCFMDSDPSHYPVTFPTAIIGIVVCLELMILLAIPYFRTRKQSASVLLISSDVLIFLGGLLPFFLLWAKLAKRMLY